MNKKIQWEWIQKNWPELANELKRTNTGQNRQDVLNFCVGIAKEFGKPKVKLDGNIQTWKSRGVIPSLSEK